MALVQLCLLPEFFHPTPSNSLPPAYLPTYICVYMCVRACILLEKVVILSRPVVNLVYPPPLQPLPHPSQRKLSAPLPSPFKSLNSVRLPPPSSPRPRTFLHLFVQLLLPFLIEYTLCTSSSFLRFREGLQGVARGAGRRECNFL